MSVMGTKRSKNLKKVLDAVPAGYLVDAPWLTAHGIAYESFRDYVKRGWLVRLARGVFRRPVPNNTQATNIDWKSAVLSLQHIMEYPIHVGGMTALTLHGHGHYLPLGTHAPVWLYGNKIPNWLTKLPLNAQLKTHSTALFSDPLLGFVKDEKATLDTLPWDWALKMSTPERAIIEALDELPEQESFHNLDMVFESLTTLRRCSARSFATAERSRSRACSSCLPIATTTHGGSDSIRKSSIWARGIVRWSRAVRSILAIASWCLRNL
jgi:hypothetical protein